MALTIKGIEAAKPKIDKDTGKAKAVRLADGDGLFLEVTKTSKRWRARYFFEGKEQMLSLGKFPVVGLKEAREKNFLLRQQLDRGINPALERKKEKSQIKDAVQEENCSCMSVNLLLAGLLFRPNPRANVTIPMPEQSAVFSFDLQRGIRIGNLHIVIRR